jgi:hypothetical protein
MIFLKPESKNLSNLIMINRFKLMPLYMKLLKRIMKYNSNFFKIEFFQEFCINMIKVLANDLESLIKEVQY